MQEGFLVVDAGSGSVKTFFVSPNGEILRSAESLWNRENWTAEKARPVILQTIKNLELAPESSLVHGVSVTSMREEFVLLDNQGIGIQYTLNDASYRHGEKTLEEFGESMYNSSGHWPVPNWIAGSILPWLKAEIPEKFNKVSSILMISDWVNYILTGERKTDGTSACETALYDVRNNNWDWSIIEELGLPSHIFPEVKNNSYRVGQVTQKIAQITGLGIGVPVLLGGADTQCGLLGMNTELGDFAAVGGTTTPVQLVVDKPVFDSKKRTWSNNHLIPKQWILESNCGYTGRGVRWAKENLGFHDYNELNKEAEEVPIGSDGLLSYLGPHRFNAGPPYWENDQLGDTPIKSSMIGKESPSRGEQARSIIESNSYAVKANLDQITGITGIEAASLKFCGGNSKSKLWMQIQANILDLPVITPKIHDGTAIGTAILAAYGSGYYSSINQATKEMVKLQTPIMPEPEQVKKYQKHYLNWMSTRKTLASQ